MSQGIKDYFHFSKGERRGVFVLLGLIGIVLIVKQFFISFEPEIFEPRKELSVLQAKLDSLSQVKKQNKLVKQKVDKNKKLELEKFNPNDYTSQDWQALGLSVKQAQVVLNYKEKAGSFESKQQVKKLFVISDELYANIEDFILLPDSVEKPSQLNRNDTLRRVNKPFQRKKRTYAKVYINTADTAQFKKLYGIGEVLSQRIVTRREELGGFYAKEQLKEIWGLKSELLANLDTLLILDEVPLKKMNINSANKEELKAHPYLYWKHANAIVNYRKQHGDYNKLEDLKNVILITDTVYNKVFPYLEL